MSSVTLRLDDNLSRCEEYLDSINRDLTRYDNATVDQKNSLDQTIEKNLAELDSLINKMNNHLRSLSEGTKDYYNDEITNLRSLYSKAFTELRQKRQLYRNDAASRQSSQIASNNARSKDAVSKLDEAIREGNETNMIANETLSTLHDDRKTLENINRNLIDIDDEAENGQVRAKRMLKRAFLNGCIAWTIVVILVCLLGFSLVYKLYIQKKK